jgi:hypothetical protein
LADETLHNPNGYPEGLVRAAVTAADARRHERRSASAKKAVQKRAASANNTELPKSRLGYWQGKHTPGNNCAICGRFLDDRASINRSIGSECWQGVLAQITAIKAKLAGVVSSDSTKSTTTGGPA